MVTRLTVARDRLAPALGRAAKRGVRCRVLADAIGSHAGLRTLRPKLAALGVELNGVRVTASGGFDTATWQSTGIGYDVQVRSDAPAGQVAHLMEVVDEVAEIPRAIRAGATVRRVS